MNRERLKEVAIINLASNRGITHRALQYQMNGSTPLNTPSETSMSDSVWGSIKSGSSMSPESVARYWQPYESESIMKELVKKGLVEPSSSKEQASSSTSNPVYPTGVNPAPFPDPKQKPEPKPKGRPAGSTNKPKDKATMERLLFGS